MIASDTAYTGVTEANTSHGVYTLFDDDGYVIAAVVVGEDDGTTTNYAYVTSDSMNRESYDKEKDEYTWSREAIVNGELVTLTETGSSNPELRGMVRGSWYEVKYYADGTVRRVTEIKTDDGNNTVDPYEFYKGTVSGTYPKFIGLIEYVEGASDDNDTVVLYEDLTGSTSYVLSVKGSTLQVDTASGTGRGFAVSPSAKTVLIQDSVTSSGKVTLMDDIYEYTGGSAGLERAVRNLNDNAKFKGYIGAVIENGVATSVVIYDKTETDINTGVPGADIDGVTVDLSNPAAVKVNYTGSTAPTPDQAISAIVSALQKAGWTVNGMKQTATGYEFDARKTVNGIEMSSTYTWDGTSTQVVTITLDGTSKTVTAGTTLTANGATGNYAKKSDGTFVATSTNVVNGESYTSGYYKVSGTLEQSSAGVIGSTTDSYTYATTLTTGTGEYVAADTAWYVQAGAVLTITFENNAQITATTKDTITVTATNATLNPVGGAVDYNNNEAANTEKTVTMTTFVNDVTVSISGATS